MDFHRIWAECPADSSLKLPWEHGFWKTVFESPTEPNGIMDWKVAEPPLFVLCASRAEPAPAKKLRVSEPLSWHHIVRSGAEQTWKDKREADFQVALRRWHDVLILLPCSIIVVQQLLHLKTTAERLRMLRDVFWKKAPSTLRKRVHSFLRFTSDLETRRIAFPGAEADFYHFLDGLRVAGAPASRIQSIIQSLLFVQHVVGVQELDSLTSSRRCLGVSGCRNTGPKRQADPFKVTDLVALHSVLLDSSRDSWDRCMAGMILLAVYSRSRWNDLQQAESMLLDCGPDGVVAYAELKIADHKTKHSTAFRNCFLHACAPAAGVVDDGWITVWTQVRAELGISFEAGHPTMPAPLEDGGISMRPLSSEEMKQWTSILLHSVQIETDGRRLTSHSCKCTLLSWCSKRGLPWEDRLVLGGHTSAVRSALVYARDGLGRPLRMLEKLLLEVRLGRFLPDATRSGRFPGPFATAPDFDDGAHSEFSYAPSLGFGDPVDDTANSTFHDGWLKPVEPCDKSSEGPHAALECKVEASGSVWELADSSEVIDLDTCSEDSGCSVATTSSSSDEEAAELSSARRPVHPPKVPNQLKLLQHRKLKTLHLMELQNQRIMLCGRVAEPSRYESVQETRFDTPCCHTCWRKMPEYA